MNFIHQLRAKVAELERREAVRQARVQAWLADFRAHLAQPKFQGAETDGGRRDWIATADVRNWLANLAPHIVAEATEGEGRPHE